MSSVEKWIWLSLAVNAGTQKAKRLISHFGTIDAIFSASAESCKSAPAQLNDKDRERLSDKSLICAHKIISECAKKDIRIIVPSDAEYPERLWNISNPPTVLYARGEALDIDSCAAIAIVGTRRASKQGEEAARKLGGEISECGGLVVTGLARGIDSAAAKGALGAGGRVVAVLGCGVDICYPRENRRLFDAVAKSGTIISEYPPGTEPSRDTFPRRNRIMSGISLGAVVVEAPKKSGALITASHALEQNRDVFAVPSGIFESAGVGSNELIRAGAMPVMSGYDVMAEYEGVFGVKITAAPEKSVRTAAAPAPAAESRRTEPSEFRFPNGYLDKFSDEDRAIMTAIAGQELRADDIADKSGLKMQRVLALLTLLEIRGHLRQLPGGKFKIKDINN